MNGEPFCYGTRLTVRNMLEMRANGLTPDEMLAADPRAAARRHRRGIRVRRASNKTRYADFFEKDGALRGPGFTRRRGRRGCPEHLRDR